MTTDYREGDDAKAAQTLAWIAEQREHPDCIIDLEYALESLFAPIGDNPDERDWKAELRTSLRKVRNG